MMDHLGTLQPWSWKLLLTAMTTLSLVFVAGGWLLRRLRPYDAEEQAVDYSVPTPEPPSPERTVKRTGIRMEGSSAVQCYAPATGRFLGLVNPCSAAAVDRAVASAGRAQVGWCRTSMAQRRAVLRSLLRHVVQHGERICRVASLDSGKTLADAHLGELLVTAERIRWTISHGEMALRPERRRTGSPLMLQKRNWVRYEALGVVASLISWNYPFHNLMGPVVSALFAGNAIVVKVSERTAWSASYFCAIARGALVAHGHDPMLVHALVCWPGPASHLVSHPAVSHVTFVGSRPVARLVASAAARVPKQVVAELGGKDACVVLESAADDLGRIVEIILRGAFQAAGQNCIGIERVVASPSVYGRLVAALEPRVRHLRLGPEADVGALISDEPIRRLEDLVEDAVSRGARLLVGGHRHVHPRYPLGHYFEPTLLVDVRPDMPIAQTECFAPILCLLRSPSDRPQDLLAIANAPDFGLGASVFAHERDPSLQPVVAGIRAGMVAVNDFAAFYPAGLPFGGVAGSGYGRFAGPEGLRGLCNAKSVCEDRFAWLGVRTAIPKPFRYPVPAQQRAWAFAHSLVELGYGELSVKARGLVRLVQNM
ncbi:hypothetical protein L249_2911 [Ophiocordyceps polyrhachis-furcata BCC 54312]|uniref:aldehyde dehydrogenase (NAD(+)) n=1 Tax=Ophiocordyceps polyrhachis-furcata BCC 54312 TaxID=1330021 RepID=A0A367LMU9_9HYPO|nr:hypothetical protein L249_2911 [Ophiocordyceps polyrhachis-furcata BCC 54312]